MLSEENTHTNANITFNSYKMNKMGENLND